MTARHIVQFSSGIGSWAVAQLLTERVGRENMLLLFADTQVEDEDNYRFLHDAEQQLGVPVVRICEGRTPEQVFEDERFLANNRVALCSKILKIDPSRRWVKEHYPDPTSCVLYVGIDAGEPDRIPAIASGWAPYETQFPLTWPEFKHLGKEDLLAWCRAEGLEPPRMYDLGFGHANCGGRCVRAGQAHWLHLLEVWPERYAAAEAFEAHMRHKLGKDIAYLRASHAGKSHPLTLAQLRRRADIRTAFTAVTPTR